MLKIKYKWMIAAGEMRVNACNQLIVLSYDIHHEQSFQYEQLWQDDLWRDHQGAEGALSNNFGNNLSGKRTERKICCKFLHAYRGQTMVWPFIFYLKIILNGGL